MLLSRKTNLKNVLLPIQEHVFWCAIFIAREHRREDIESEDGGVWGCDCRCCVAVRERL
jgi:hypothetical protein